MAIEEVWRPVKGYEGRYEVSNLGRVKRLEYVVKCKDGKSRVYAERILKISYDGYKGYLGVSLNGRRKKLHRLVAETFIPNPGNKPIVNHKDENKLNNKADNLEWCDHIYNNNYGTKKERLRNSNKGKKHLRYDVYQRDKDGEIIQIFPSIREASRTTGITYDSIRRCGHSEKGFVSAGGYFWELRVKEPEKGAFDIE